MTISQQKLKTNLHIQIAISTYIMSPHIHNILSAQLFSGKQMKSWFLKREYREKLIENEMRKVKFSKEGIKKAK